MAYNYSQVSSANQQRITFSGLSGASVTFRFKLATDMSAANHSPEDYWYLYDGRWPGGSNVNYIYYYSNNGNYLTESGITGIQVNSVNATLADMLAALAGDVIEFTSDPGTAAVLFARYAQATGVYATTYQVPEALGIKTLEIDDANGTHVFGFPGSGNTFPDSLGIITATILNAPADDSQWVYYSAGGGTTVTAAFSATSAGGLALAPSVNRSAQVNTSSTSAESFTPSVQRSGAFAASATSALSLNAQRLVSAAWSSLDSSSASLTPAVTRGASFSASASSSLAFQESGGVTAQFYSVSASVAAFGASVTRSAQFSATANSSAQLTPNRVRAGSLQALAASNFSASATAIRGASMDITAHSALALNGSKLALATFNALAVSNAVFIPTVSLPHITDYLVGSIAIVPTFSASIELKPSLDGSIDIKPLH